MEKKWLHQRKVTFSLYFIYLFLTGIQSSIILSGMVNVLKNVVQTDRPELYLGLSIFVTPFLALACGQPMARYADRTRNVKLIVCVCCGLAMLSNFSFCISLSPWFVVVTRALQALTWPAMACIAGESVRCYSIQETARIVSINFMMYEVGMLMGPSLYLIAPTFRVHCHQLTFTEDLVPPFLVGLIYAVLLLVIFKFATNVSLVYDLKEHEQSAQGIHESEVNDQNTYQENNEKVTPDKIKVDSNNCKYLCEEANFEKVKSTDKLLSEPNENNDDPLSLKEVLLISSVPLLLSSMLATTVANYTFGTAQVLVASGIYNYTSRQVGLLFSVSGTTYLASTYLLTRLSDRIKQTTILLFTIAALIAALELLAMTVIPRKHFTAAVLLYVYTVLRGFGSVSEQIISAEIAQKIPSNTQAFAESLLRSCTYLSIIITGFIPLFFQHIGLTITLVMFSNVFVFLVLFYKTVKR